MTTPVLHCVQCGLGSTAQESSGRCSACGSPLIDLRSSSLDARQRAVADAILASKLRKVESRAVVIGAALGFAMPIAAYLTFPYALGAESALLALLGGICGGIAGKLALPVIVHLLGKSHPLAYFKPGKRQRIFAAGAVVMLALLGVAAVGTALYVSVQEAQQLRRQILIAAGGHQDPVAAARLLDDVRDHRRDLARCFVVERDVINRLAAVATARIRIDNRGRVESLRPDAALKCVTTVLGPSLLALGPSMRGGEVQVQIVVRRPLFGDKPVLLLPNTVNFGT